MKNVLIAGGTGLVGKALSDNLSGAGYQIRHLSRKARPEAAFPTFAWNPEKGEIDPAALQDVDAVINLAGEGIADKLWTAERKKKIIDSRVQATRLLRQAIAEHGKQVQVFLSASAIGYYGNRGDEWMAETAKPGKGFLSDSTLAWEKAIEEVAATGLRTAWFRIGIVLTTRGGAMEKLLLPMRMGLGGYFGDGKQWYPWIHIDDVCGTFRYALEKPSINGPYNAVAPAPATNRDLVREIARVKGGVGLVASGPAFVMRLAMGEMADVILNGTRVSADKIIAAGYSFRYPVLQPALEDLIRNGK